MKRIACSVVATLLWVSVGAGAAHADDQSYLDVLNSEVPYWPALYVDKLQAGHTVCNELHAGSTPQQFYDSHNYPSRIFRWQMIEIAQRELCPDTLGR